MVSANSGAISKRCDMRLPVRNYDSGKEGAGEIQDEYLALTDEVISRVLWMSKGMNSQRGETSS